MKPYRRDLKLLSRKLRSNSTDAESAAWRRLRNRQLCGLQFYRQKPLLDYIVDFYCPQARLVIEIDGAQHFGSDGAANDVIRDARLASIGLKVLRFNNVEVLREIDNVVAAIVSVIEGLDI